MTNEPLSIITYYAKSVYGEYKLYISDPDIARKIQALTGQKTLTDWAQKALEDLGYQFQEVIAPR